MMDLGQPVPNREKLPCPQCRSILQMIRYRDSFVIRCRVCSYYVERLTPVTRPDAQRQPGSEYRDPSLLKKCAGCGQPFLPTNNNQIYHSEACRTAAYAEKAREARESPRVAPLRQCAFCGNELSAARPEDAKFCDNLCAYRAEVIGQ